MLKILNVFFILYIIVQNILFEINISLNVFKVFKAFFLFFEYFVFFINNKKYNYKYIIIINIL